MTLILTLTGGGPLPPQVKPQWTLRQDRVAIGRSDEASDWVLPDPDKHLSRRHCVVEFRDGGYLVSDTSTNGVFLNDDRRPLGPDRVERLHDGDVLTLGEYRIEVRLADDRGALAEPEDEFGAVIKNEISRWHGSDGPGGGATAGGRGFPTEEPYAPRSPLADEPPGRGYAPDDLGTGFGITPQSRPDDDLFGPASPGRDSEFGLSEGSGIGGDASAYGEFDPLAPQPRPTWTGTTPDHVPGDQGYFRLPEPIDPPPDPRGDPGFGGAGYGGPGNPIGEDWNAPSNPAAQAGRGGEDGGFFGTGRAMEPSRPPPRRPARPAGGLGDDSAALQTFLAAAGLDGSNLPPEAAAAMLQRAGELFGEMVRGLCDILAARSAVKNEMRVERTQFGANNNPLKFSASAEEAMQRLLRPTPGYMSGTRAVRDALNDVKAHEMALPAAMQSALAATLKQFDPAQLKRKIDQQGGIPAILPAARKARYWEAYELLFERLAADAQDNFHGAFGRELARAYEEQEQQWRRR